MLNSTVLKSECQQLQLIIIRTFVPMVTSVLRDHINQSEVTRVQLIIFAKLEFQQFAHKVNTLGKQDLLLPLSVLTVHLAKHVQPILWES